MTGAPLSKREDPPLLRGEACFVADAPLREPLHLAFVRSEAAGQFDTLDLADAREVPGVVAVHDGTEVAGLGALSVNPILPVVTPLPYPILAQGEVMAAGQPIAAVLAETEAAAQDGVEAIWADIAAVEPAPVAVAEQGWTTGDVDTAFREATHVVTVSVKHPRLAPSPMEPRGIAIKVEGDNATIWHSTQTPHRTRSELARILSVDPARLRVIARDVGGAFGMKASLYPEEVFAVWAALHHRRDVRWIATRSEDFLSATHGRGVHSEGALAVAEDGTFLALHAKVTAPIGPWLPNSGLIPAWNAARMLPCGYDIDTVQITTTAQQDGLGPTGIYRGAGRPEANVLMERLVDNAARATGLDPVTIRRKNLLSAGALPKHTPCGNTLDSGDYAALLDGLLGAAGYAALTARRDALRRDGQLAGLGLAFYLEPSGEGWESARVTLQADGTAHVASGSSSQGHGRQTSYARIAANALGLSESAVSVSLGDTETDPEGIGALASRATAIGGSAVLKACLDLLAKREDGAGYPIEAEVRYANDGQAWGYGAALALVKVDPETGMVAVQKVACLDDAGTLIVPELAHGQIVGGFAQGFGEALMEAVHHDADGELLTGSFMDYALPRATDVPPLDIHTAETPSPTNLLGAKGLGEAGTIAAPAVLLSAVLDALAPLGITDLDMPLTPCKVWSAMQDAKG
ncbi:xanthine dehydrogenase family protein molybdopterin-binding subunit [Pseudaestuariivita sp.]|uniref:xanthine dehydrogenase family protein molybdopterin-binding subunit n=1 Tax=Pseudaestuariivita sp. TaxID=2211669 RepID=UPI0040587366